MKGCVDEYSECSVDEIAEKYIEGTPEVGTVGVHVDETNRLPRTPEVITGSNNEDSTLTEGTVHYDVRFDAIASTAVHDAASQDVIRLIINVEAQTAFNPGYPLTKRAIYYCSRMISAQHGPIFKKSEYGKIRKVYSIWVCTKPSDEFQNTLTRYALGYTFTETVVPPTCTEDGYTLHTCNENPAKTYQDTPVAALGHQYKEVTTPATCGAPGSVDNVCERCNDKQHVKDLPATGEHQWDEGVVTKEPTATETGIKTFTCTVCSATKTEDIVKVHTHDYTRLGEIVKESSCETEGERWVYCNYEGCNERVLKPMPAIGSHDWDFASAECLKKATCTEQGTMRARCKRDASHTTTYSYGGTGHIWDEGVITTQPTYEEYGEKTLHCKNCNATMTEKVLPTKYTFTVTVVPPTCTEDGYTMHKCNQDDSLSYKDNFVHSTGHHAAKRVIESTCKEEGRTEIYCKVCGDVSSTFDFTPKKDHTWDNGVVTTEPTAEKEGVKTYTCTVCNETKTETIPRLNGSGK